MTLRRITIWFNASNLACGKNALWSVLPLLSLVEPSDPLTVRRCFAVRKWISTNADAVIVLLLSNFGDQRRVGLVSDKTLTIHLCKHSD